MKFGLLLLSYYLAIRYWNAERILTCFFLSSLESDKPIIHKEGFHRVALWEVCVKYTVNGKLGL